MRNRFMYSVTLNRFIFFLKYGSVIFLSTMLAIGDTLSASNIPQIAAGQTYSVALRLDGTVWTSGLEANGELGNGTGKPLRKSFLQVSGLNGIRAIAIGYNTCFAITADGTVWSWGRNDRGQLGNGTTKNIGTPMLVNNLDNVITIASGHGHSIVLKSDGTVWACGANRFGQLGDGTNINKSTPVQVRNLSGVIAIAAGLFHSLALKSDGTVWAWGQGDKGQLGDGTTIDKSTPAQVRGLDGIIAIACGAKYNIALKADGTVWGWGFNFSGQLGEGTKQYSSIPVQVNSLGGVVAIASKYGHCLALKSDSTVWAWGLNDRGQLGNGSTINRTTPVQVSDLKGIINIACGEGHSLALKSDGTLWMWGYEWGHIEGGENYPIPIKVNINLYEKVSKEQQEEERKRQEIIARKAKEEQERAEAIKRREEFIKKNGVKEWPGVSELVANPFVYEGKIVALRAHFETMQTATQGIFGVGNTPVIVSDIPKGMFKEEGLIVVLASKVLGKTETKLPLVGTIQVPHLKFVGVHFCKDNYCKDIIPE